MLSIRKIGVIGRTYRNLNRYRQILAVLLKYGFGDLLELLKLDQYVAAGLQLISKKQPIKVEKLTRPQGLRMALEELGPTYIKLGQILSTRPDLIPVDFLQELSKLQDKVPPFPAHAARKIIETELGVMPENLFTQFDDTPLASASIGQVHMARTRDEHTADASDAQAVRPAACSAPRRKEARWRSPHPPDRPTCPPPIPR